MIQRMRNKVPITVPEIDLTAVSNIEVTLEQRSTNVEYTYSGDAVEVADAHVLFVSVPKEDAMQFDTRQILGQVMYTQPDGLPNATKIFKVSVDELLKEDGYGD